MRTITRWLAALVFCAAALTGLAAAEGALVKVGATNEGRGIFRYEADNGQALYFLALEPVIRYEDVNFDGVQDIVVSTVMGASNFFYEFFVRDGDEYVLAEHVGAEYGLCNYELYPDQGLVLSAQNNGYAGALFDRHLFRWEGATLTLVRSAVSSEYSTTEFAGAMFTTVTDTQKIRVVMSDFDASQVESATIYDETFTLDDVTASLFDEWNERMFAGL